MHWDQRITSCKSHYHTIIIFLLPCFAWCCHWTTDNSPYPILHLKMMWQTPNRHYAHQPSSSSHSSSSSSSSSIREDTKERNRSRKYGEKRWRHRHQKESAHETGTDQKRKRPRNDIIIVNTYIFSSVFAYKTLQIHLVSTGTFTISAR